MPSFHVFHYLCKHTKPVLRTSCRRLVTEINFILLCDQIIYDNTYELISTLGAGGGGFDFFLESSRELESDLGSDFFFSTLTENTTKLWLSLPKVILM